MRLRLLHAIIIGCIVLVVAIPFYGELKNRIASSELLLNMYKSSLESEISRYKFLPFILSQNEKFTQIITGEFDKVDSGYFLQRIKYATNVATIYVQSRDGTAIASSNWESKGSYVGKNFATRPYFKDAMVGRLGQFYGVGLASATPGFFISYALKSGQEFVGTITIEINLSDLEDIWRSGPDDVMVYDVNDIIFLSSNKLWKHKIFGKDSVLMDQRASAAQRPEQETQTEASLVKCYRYGDITLYRDPFFGCLFPTKASIEEKIIEFGWTIISLKQTGYFYASALLVVLISLLFYAILIFSYRSFRNNFNRKLLKLRNQLVENSKLAAIGQMATELAHEFNQPLSAIYMLLDTTRLLLARKQYGDVDDNLMLTSSHIERMTQQISELKSFASRHRVPRGNADIVSVANASIRLFQQTLKKNDVQLSFETSHGELHVPCNEIGLEQIISNLITNALEAMIQQPKKIIAISIGREDEKVLVIVRDNGSGIQDPSKIFESFYSTKQRGTGLGLAIVNGIVENSGGTILARNHPDGGAEFVLKWKELIPELTARSISENVERGTPQ